MQWVRVGHSHLPRPGAVVGRRLPRVTEHSSTATAVAAPLVVRTVRVEDPGPLLSLLPDTPDATAWVRRGEGVVGWGVAAICRTAGPRRFAEAGEWWSEVTRSAVVRDEVDRPGSGVVAFGSFGFADEPGDSVLVVPEVVVGRRGDTTWVTTIGVGALSAPATVRPTDAPHAPRGIAFSDGHRSGIYTFPALRGIESAEVEDV